jgi:hypothetical protein
LAKREKEYRRLPGRGVKRGSFLALTGIRSSLWEGKDHLLCLYRTAYTEDYRRFYYRDIQAFVTRKTAHGAVWNGIFFLLVALLAAPAFFVSSFWSAFLGSFSFFFLLLLAVNWLMGPTCVCHLQTRVSKEELPSLNRLRKTKKVIDLLRPRIEGTQGALTADEIAAKSRESPPSNDAPAAPGARAAQAVRAANDYGGIAHEALFYLLLMEGALNAIGFSVHHIAINLSGWALSLAILITVVVALAKQHESEMAWWLKRVTWWTLIYVCATFAVNYLLYTVVAVENPVLINDQWRILNKVALLSPSDSAILRFKLIFSAASTFSIALPGLVLLMYDRRSRKARRQGSFISAGSAASTDSAGEGEPEGAADRSFAIGEAEK